MYKKYCKKIIEPLLLENGYSRTSNVVFKKKLLTGIEIVIDIQKFKGKNFITINIAVINDVSNFEDDGMVLALSEYRLDDFFSDCQYDIWWSVEKADINESFLQIEDVIKNTLLPELDKLEDKEFAQDFIRNIELSRRLGKNF